MKKLLLLGTLSLAGCANLPAPPIDQPGLLSPLVSSGIITQATRDKARQVQAASAQYCQFVPTLGTAISIINGAIGAGVETIGAGICNAVTTAPLADGGKRLAYYNGVKIEGKFKR